MRRKVIAGNWKMNMLPNEAMEMITKLAPDVKETEKISKEVEAMIIVGGKNSSNTTKLYDISKKNCQNVIFVQNADELDVQKVKGFKKVGIMAGASTPQKSVEEIIEKLGGK